MAITDQNHRRVYNQREVDGDIWRACAGSSVQIPAVNSAVYYFPEGHVEQSCASVAGSLSPLVTSKPSIPCRVLEVRFLADPDTDEVFAKIRLEPVNVGFFRNGNGNGNANRNGNESSVVSFAKVLTPSDANNGGGFSVPRFCADSIFPPLDYAADPPVQNIRISDVHGEVWEFRHIYRGTPRRHLLTTGWSKFVNSKKLIAGDSVVFITNKSNHKLFVGVRRAVKQQSSSVVSNNESVGWGGGSSGGQLQMQYGGGVVSGGGFSRNGKGRVPPEAVIEAAEKAANGVEFEVVYYPRAGLPDFVVAAEKVEGALGVFWSTGMRVKMAMETEDSSRMTWFQGTVASVVVPDNGVWNKSTWRMLQVAWDEPEILQNMKRVSPWQVEYVAPAPPIHTAFPPSKKLRVPGNSGLLTDGEGDFPLPRIGFGSVMGQLSSSLNYNTFPAGMQGARQNPFLLSSLPSMNDGTHYMCRDDMNDGTQHTCRDDNLENDYQKNASLENDYKKNASLENVSQKVEAVSTDLNIGSSPDTPSRDSQSSELLSGTDTSGQKSSNTSGKTGSTSFQLFGKTIHMESSVMETYAL